MVSIACERFDDRLQAHALLFQRLTDFLGGILFGWAATLHPFYNAGGAYAEDGLYRSGLQEDSFWASLG